MVSLFSISALSLTHMKHFVFGFILDPGLHLNAFANSLEFDNVPITLNILNINLTH